MFGWGTSRDVTYPCYWPMTVRIGGMVTGQRNVCLPKSAASSVKSKNIMLANKTLARGVFLPLVSDKDCCLLEKPLKVQSSLRGVYPDLLPLVS